MRERYRVDPLPIVREGTSEKRSRLAPRMMHTLRSIRRQVINEMLAKPGKCNFNIFQNGASFWKFLSVKYFFGASNVGYTVCRFLSDFCSYIYLQKILYILPFLFKWTKLARAGNTSFFSAVLTSLFRLVSLSEPPMLKSILVQRKKKKKSRLLAYIFLTFKLKLEAPPSARVRWLLQCFGSALLRVHTCVSKGRKLALKAELLISA